MRETLRELARARIRQRVERVDFWETLYRAYAALFVVGGVTFGLSLVLGDPDLGTHARAMVLRNGPRLADVAAAAAIAAGLRSGARGGPLLVEEADVMQVLLSPVPRRLALRSALLHHLRSAAGIGAGAGAVAGLLLAQRLRAGPEWVLSGVVYGVVTALAASGAAMVSAGLRVRTQRAGAVGLALIAAAAAGPAPFGSILWRQPRGFAGVALALAVLAAGVALVDRTSLEALRRRSRLVSLLRFSASMNDIRAVALARRSLALESARARPWVRLRTRSGRPLWRRTWHGVLRWPLGRVLRMLALGAAAGAAARGVHAGARPLVAVAGLALFAAGLEGAEALGALVDRPTLARSFPVQQERLEVRLFLCTLAPTAVAVSAAVAAAVLIAPLPGALRTAVVLAPGATLCAASGAAVSTLRRKSWFEAWEWMLPAEAMGPRVAFRVGWPPAIATLGVLPVLTPAAAWAGPAIGVLAAVLVVAWLAFRVRIAAALEQSVPAWAKK